MKTIKVIDLLNKIANGEVDRNNKYRFSRDDYCTINDFFARYIVDEENLNLEIIEEDTPKEEKKIEKLDYIFDIENPTYKENWLMCCIEANKNKINEIIDKVNGEDNERNR